MLARRVVGSLAIAIATSLSIALTFEGTARADRAEEIRACAQSHEHAQVLRKDGKLVDATKELYACSKPLCPAQIRLDCSSWVRDVEGSVPTIVIVARNGGGADVPDARILIDGREVTAAEAGRAFAIDPGTHVARAEHAGSEPVQQSFVVHEGEKLRTIQLVFGSSGGPAGAPPDGASGSSPSAPGEASERRGAPVLGYVLLGAGVVALGTGGVFFVKQILDYNALDSSCKPNCSRSESKAIDTERLVAGIAGGVGLAAAVAGVWLLVNAPKATSGQGTHAPRVAVDVASSGATVHVGFVY